MALAFTTSQLSYYILYRSLRLDRTTFSSLQTAKLTLLSRHLLLPICPLLSSHNSFTGKPPSPFTCCLVRSLVHTYIISLITYHFLFLSFSLTRFSAPMRKYFNEWSTIVVKRGNEIRKWRKPASMYQMLPWASHLFYLIIWSRYYFAPFQIRRQRPKEFRNLDHPEQPPAHSKC